MEGNNTITLSMLVQAYVNYINETTDENKELVENLYNALHVRSYLSFEEKHQAIKRVLDSIKIEDYDTQNKERLFIKAKVVYIQLAYIDNLTNDIAFEEIDESILDVLYQSGLIDYLNSVAGKDIALLCSMLDDALNFDHLFSLLNSMRAVDSQKIEGLIKIIASFQDKLTPEALADFKQLAISGSPEYEALLEIIKEKTLNEANDEMAKEEKIPDSINKGDA